jgi:hypothetical protein
MKSKKAAEYLAAFPSFSPEKKREHLAIALSFLAKLILEKQQAAPALDVDTIDGECTVGGEA